MLDDFMELSRVLTGVENLYAKLGRQYVDRLNSGPLQPQLREVLDKFHGLKKGDTLFQQVKEKIVVADDLRAISRAHFTSLVTHPMETLFDFRRGVKPRDVTNGIQAPVHAE